MAAPAEMTAFALPTLRRRIRLAAPPSLVFGLISAVVLLASVGFGLWSKGFAAFPRTVVALAVLSLPPALVGMLAAYLIDCLLPAAGRAARGLLMAFAILCVGPGASAAFFNIAYRFDYPSDLAPVWTKVGLHEAVWTAISTTYLYLIAAPLLYWPWSLVAAIALATAYAAAPPAMGRFARRH